MSRDLLNAGADEDDDQGDAVEPTAETAITFHIKN